MSIRSITLDIDDAVYQQALAKAKTQGQTMAQVLATLLTQWAGPVPQPAPAPGAPPPAPAPAPATRTYTVQPGDTLGGIARQVYGNAAKYPLIAEANQISDPRRIWVGQVLTIPPLPDAPDKAPPSAPVLQPQAPPATGSAPVSVAPTPETPTITWVGSPNFNQRPNPNDIWAIVIHSTANSSLEGVINWFNNPQALVSAHYSIGKDGRIVRHVRDENRAWHAGKSEWKGVPNVNNYAIGIELVNLNDGQDPYPEEQHQANVQLCINLCRKHNIKTENIMGHLDIAVPKGRKTDPRGYDLERLRREVSVALSA
jgi:N-acetylmuramoyl-L-alanine amidase